MNKLKAVVDAQKEIMGSTTKDIAEALEMSEGNVRKIIREQTISYKVLVMLSNYLHFSDDQKKQIL